MMSRYFLTILMSYFSIAISFELPLFNETDFNHQVKPNINFNNNISNFALDKTIDKNNYIVGPGDQFKFNMVSTSRVINLSLQVNPTGDIYIPAIGSIDIDGMILIDATNKLVNLCKEHYPNSTVSIDLEKVRQIKVNLVGAISYKNSQITLTSSQRLSDLFEILNSKFREDMYLDFEPKEDEKLPKIKELSSRRIILTRNGKDYNIDLDQYFIMGNLSQNPYLMQNDIVKFHYKDRYISIFGGIVNEGQIEYIDGDNLKTIIDLAGGFSSDSDTGYVEITRFINRNDIERFTINNYSRHNSTKIEEFDHIYVRKIQNYKSQELITVEGEIQYPGVYSISDGSNTVGNLIEKCGGVTFMGDKNSIIINNTLIEQNPDSELRRILQIPVENRNNTEISYVKARNSITKGLIRSNNIEFTNSIYNFLLSPGDHIIIPKKIDYVEVIGAIKHPGRYPFLMDYNPDDYITLSGGLTKNSTRKKYIIKYSTGQKLPFNNKLKIERGDIIFISEKIDYNSWDRFKEWMAIISQISTTIIVIQNILGN